MPRGFATPREIPESGNPDVRFSDIAAPHFPTLLSAGTGRISAKSRARGSGVKAGRLVPLFRRQPPRGSAEIGVAGGIAVPPEKFRGVRVFGIPGATPAPRLPMSRIPMSRPTTSRRRVPRRCRQLLRRTLRQETESGTRRKRTPRQKTGPGNGTRGRLATRRGPGPEMGASARNGSRRCGGPAGAHTPAAIWPRIGQPRVARS